MADAYYYSSTAGRMALTGGVSSANTAITVDTTAGLPASLPFKLTLDPGLSKEEIVKVTAVAGNTLTITRGIDGTAAQSHDNAAEVRHMATAEDLRLSRQHESATLGVHGITGSVVGTSDTQTLTGKTISGSSNTISNVPKSALPVDTTYTTTAQTLTGKTIDGGTNTLQNVPASAVTGQVTANTNASNHIAAASGVHGVTGSVVGTTDVQTLTGKTLSGASNTFTNIPSSALPSVTFYNGQGTALSCGTGTFSGAITSSSTITSQGNLYEGANRVFSAANPPAKANLPADTVYTTTAQTLTGKTIDGGSNTLQNVPKAALPASVAYDDEANTFTKGQVIKSSSNTEVPLIAQQFGSGSTADLQQWTDYIGGVKAKIDITGNLTANNISDTGWINLSGYQSGFGAGSTGETPAVRLKNGIVHYRGALTWTGSGGFTTALTLPAGYRPPVNRTYPCSGNTTTTMCIMITNTGLLQLWSSGVTGSYYSLSHITYPID